MREQRRRRGVAVAAVLFTMVVLGALLAGTLFQSTHEMRNGVGQLHIARARAAADLGIEQIVASWDRRWNGMYARGAGFEQRVDTPEGAAVLVDVLRLSDELVLIGAEARVAHARRQAARLVRLRGAWLDPPSVLTAGSGVAVAGAIVNGADHLLDENECPDAAPPLPIVAVVSDTGALLRTGGVPWSELAASATARVGVSPMAPVPTSTGSTCDVTDPSNWGEPRKRNGGPCTSYYAIIHAAGDLIITSGRGQGLLIVDGDLSVRGAFEFAGVVLVRGAVRVPPGTAHISGVMSVAGLAGAGISDMRGATIEWSRCAVSKALLSVARPQPLAERSWFEVRGRN